MINPSRDALSDVLRLIRLKACVYFLSDFSSPWGMHMDAGPFAQFHLVVRGQCVLTANQQHHQMGPGDIAVFTHGGAHALADAPTSTTRPGLDVLTAYKSGSPLFQEGEKTTRVLCGHFEFDRSLKHPLIRDLPNLIHIKGMEQGHPNWLEAVTPILIGETQADMPGNETMVERLAEVLLIQVLRTHLQAQTQASGFLAALGDAAIHRALAYIHSRADGEITLADIAKAVGMSRSSLAARFKQLVGNSPMTYLTNWRMLKAKDMLMSGNARLADVAEQVGYRSEAAFSRAFKREYQTSPSAFRRSLHGTESYDA